MRPIGVINSPFKTKDECPLQPAFAPDAQGRVEVFPEFAPGLQDIETFTHVYLLYSLDRAGEVILVRPTFLDDRPHGVFASRHPSRPNQIGLSVVRLLERQGDTLLVQGIDVLDQTPLLDIKPYMPGYDAIKDATMGGRPGSVGVPSPEAASEEDSFDYGFLRTGLPATRGLLDGIRTTSARHQTILPLPRGLNCRPGRHSRNSAKAAGRSGDESR